MKPTISFYSPDQNSYKADFTWKWREHLEQEVIGLENVLPKIKGQAYKATNYKPVMGRNFGESQKHSTSPSGKPSTWWHNVGVTAQDTSNNHIKKSYPINYHHVSAQLLHVPADIFAIVSQGVTSQDKQVNCNPDRHRLLPTGGKLSTRRTWHWKAVF